MRTLFLLAVLTTSLAVQAQNVDTLTNKLKQADKKTWYQKMNLRGYTQIRYNRLLETNPDLKSDLDRSVGNNGSVLIRRGRLVWSGDVHPRMFVYIQTDFAVTAGTALHYTALRDAYFDVSIDTGEVYRIRFGQSKIPFGYENMQSSSNRLPLERADALNSAAPGERDLGAIFMFTPKRVQKHIYYLNKNAMKHSGDYGMFAFGAFVGQGINRAEANNNLHVISRVSYPFGIKNQVVEFGVQGYTGFYTMSKDQLSSGTKTNSDATYLDRRAAASFVLYPKPFGILAEYNIGNTPMYNAANDSITTGYLEGGFITLSYFIPLKKGGEQLVPFARAQYFDGAKKIDTDARRYKVNEYEFGFEYLIFKNFELTVDYCISYRNTSDKAKENNAQQGNFLRIQVQLNY